MFAFSFSNFIAMFGFDEFPEIVWDVRCFDDFFVMFVFKRLMFLKK